jgi:peroxiredoxin
MTLHRLLRLSLAACLGFATVAPFADAQTTQPAAPATQPAAGAEPPTPVAPAQIDPSAAELVSQLKSAYGQLTALEVAGKASSNFDIAGQKSQQSQEFAASFAVPNKFRHQSKDGILIGSTGEKVYVFSKDENVFLTIDAPNKEKFPTIPQPIGNMLFGENPSLLMAILQDPMQVLNGSSVKRAPDVAVDGKAHPALHVSGRDSLEELTLLLDPSTHLLRRVTTDLSKQVEKRGAPDIKAAEFVVDYTTTTLEADQKPEQYAWAPPEGARDAAASPAHPSGAPGGEATALEGKPAPVFALKGLDDKEVKLSDLKGKVVVLDFWATWCGPCVASLPALDKFASEQGEHGAKVFAINIQQEKEHVQSFMTAQKLTLPVLLDIEGKVRDDYKADAIPQTVIIGKDGNVRKVIIGGGNEKAIADAVADALAGK